MSHRSIRLCLALITTLLVTTGLAVFAEAATRGLPPCPPRERGAPQPEGCYDPCPSGMVGDAPDCSCPAGTKLAERPRTPTERCVAVKYNDLPAMAIERNDNLKYQNLVKPCPEGHIGTYPDCHCPPGLMGTNCNYPILR